MKIKENNLIIDRAELNFHAFKTGYMFYVYEWKLSFFILSTTIYTLMLMISDLLIESVKDICKVWKYINKYKIWIN